MLLFSVNIFGQLALTRGATLQTLILLSIGKEMLHLLT